MEQKISCGSVSDQLPPISAKYPWFVTEEDDTKDQIFYTINDTPPSHYRCRIPELLGKQVKGYFHGWVVLFNYYDNTMWSLWNPLTSKIIRLPPLKDIDPKTIGQCCLLSPPDDPTSIFLLTRTDKPNFVFCRLDRKMLEWAEMSYLKQLKKITRDGGLVHSLTCCNGKIYALNTDTDFAEFVVHVDIVVKDREVVISLFLFGACPFFDYNPCPGSVHFLKGSSTELFYILVGINEKTKDTIDVVYLFKLDTTRINWEDMESLKNWDMTDMRWEEMEDEEDLTFPELDMTSMMWEEMEDLKDAIFFLDYTRDCSVFYSREIASEFGGYIHIRGEMGNILYSYHVKDKSISQSYMPSQVLPTSHVSLWECRVENDHGEAKHTADAKHEEEQEE